MQVIDTAAETWEKGIGQFLVPAVSRQANKDNKNTPST